MNEENKKKIIFIVRIIVWTLFACVLPCAFIIWRYDLFRVVSKVQIGGWGLLLGVILLIFTIIFLKYILRSKKWNYWKQIVKGFMLLIVPLCFLMYCLNCVKDTITQLLQVLACITLCEAVAICVNPLPEWAYKESKGETADIIDLAFEKYERKKDGK